MVVMRPCAVCRKEINSRQPKDGAVRIGEMVCEDAWQLSLPNPVVLLREVLPGLERGDMMSWLI